MATVSQASGCRCHALPGRANPRDPRMPRAGTSVRVSRGPLQSVAVTPSDSAAPLQAPRCLLALRIRTPTTGPARAIERVAMPAGEKRFASPKRCGGKLRGPAHRISPAPEEAVVPIDGSTRSISTSRMTSQQTGAPTARGWAARRAPSLCAPWWPPICGINLPPRILDGGPHMEHARENSTGKRYLWATAASGPPSQASPP